MPPIRIRPATPAVSTGLPASLFLITTPDRRRTWRPDPAETTSIEIDLRTPEEIAASADRD